MKIYLAAKYGDMMRMREVRDQLVAAGHEITAQWIDGKEKSDAGAGLDVLVAGAKMDYDDVARSDVLMAFSHERGTLHTGGGRHVEFGFAVALDIPIIIVGPIGEHIFHYMPGNERVDSVDDAIKLFALAENT